MKQLQVTNKEIYELNRDELKNVTGGDDILSYLKCVSSTLTSGGGGFRTAVLGVTIFGMARLAGVMYGCTNFE
jgi:hypothetical protein